MTLTELDRNILVATSDKIDILVKNSPLVEKISQAKVLAKNPRIDPLTFLGADIDRDSARKTSQLFAGLERIEKQIFSTQTFDQKAIIKCLNETIPTTINHYSRTYESVLNKLEGVIDQGALKNIRAQLPQPKPSSGQRISEKDKLKAQKELQTTFEL